MKPQRYIDFNALGVEGDLPSHAIIEKTFHVLHGAFATLAKKKCYYAIALPDTKQKSKNIPFRTVGGTLRVFSDSNDMLYQLIESVSGHYILRDYIHMRMPQGVPSDFKGTWSIWRRIRVDANRPKTIIRAQKTPFIEIQSSSKHVYPLRIYRERYSAKKHDKDGRKLRAIDFIPNTYGLASIENMFALPDI